MMLKNKTYWNVALLLLLLQLAPSCSNTGTDGEATEDAEGVEITDAEVDAEGEAIADAGGEESLGEDAIDAEGTGDGTEVAATDATNLEEVSAPTDSADQTSPSEYVAEAPAGSATEAPVDSSTSSEAPGASYAAQASGATGPGDAEYLVQSNETLMMIAFKLYGDYGRWKEIASLNQDKLGGGTSISNGMKLRYNSAGAGFNWNPEGKQHLIQSGDTLSLISKSYYGTLNKWRMIWENNKPLIKDPNKIFIGFTIFVPEKGMREVASDPTAGAGLAADQSMGAPAAVDQGAAAAADAAVTTGPEAAAAGTAEDFPADI